ncbi:MAG: acyltransferase [Bellilinea sp.]
MSRKLLYLNGIAIFSVILFHSAGWVLTAMFSWFHRFYPAGLSPDILIGSPGYYGMRLIEQFVVFSIPAFLFVSGYFAAFITGKNRNTIGWKDVKPRIRNLLIPYLIWTVIVLGIGFFEGKRYSPIQIAVDVLIGNSTPAYYFVPLLIQFYLLAPIIVYLAKKYWLALLLATGIFQVIIHLAPTLALWGVRSDFADSLTALTPKWVFISRLHWFTAGAIFGFHFTTLKDTIQKLRLVWIFGVFGLMILGFAETEFFSGPIEMRETITDFIYTWFVILYFLSLKDVRLPWNSMVSELGSKSYGIYLAHIPVMEITSRGMYHLAPFMIGQPYLLFILLMIIGLGVPLIAMRIMSRSFARRYASLVFG